MSTTHTRSWTAKPDDLGLPGPTPSEMARAFWSIRADPLSFLAQARCRYGDVVAIPVPGAPVLLLNDPAQARHVLHAPARAWSKETVQYSALARVTGPGLLASSEPDWIVHRRLAAPAFHRRSLEDVADDVHKAADQAVRAWVTRHRVAAIATPVDVAPLTLRFALDAVGRSLFSSDLSGRGRPLLAASSDAAQLVVRLGRAVLPIPGWVPTPTNLRLRLASRRLGAISSDLISGRRADGATRSGSGSGSHGDDLLGLLIDGGLADREIRDELVTMIIAGHETVAASLAWTLMLLAEHPAVQDRVRAELASWNGPLSMVGHRDQLPWTRAVLDETLRLYPPAWAISRRSRQADDLHGLAVPAGTTVIISPWLLHRDEQHWPEPLSYRPQRFLDRAPAPSAYLPFGHGPRLCIGREFALGEMVIFLSRLLSTYRVETPPGWSRPRPKALVAVHPDRGMPLVVTELARAGS